MNLQENIHKIIVFSPLLILIFLAIWFFTGSGFVPERFMHERQNSIYIAQNIVSLTEESLANLDKIAEKDKKYQFKGALVLVREELNRVKQMQNTAVDLTKSLDAMARVVVNITPAKARNLAIEAITHELSLIGHLFVYNDSLNALLQTLELKFSKDIRYDAEDVQKIIVSMNQEAREINKSNESFKEKMDEFDKIVN